MSEEEVRKVFSRNLNWLIQREHLTQKMVAAICGVSTSTVSTWCKGINIPRMDKIEILANHFGVTKSDLLEEKTKGTSPAGTLPIEFSHLKKIPVLGRSGDAIVCVLRTTKKASVKRIRAAIADRLEIEREAQAILAEQC